MQTTFEFMGSRNSVSETTVNPGCSNINKGKKTRTAREQNGLPPETVAILKEKAKAAESKIPEVMEQIVLLPYRELHLHLIAAYALLLLELADADAYAEEVFERLRQKYKGRYSVKSRPTMYKYTAPLLEWIRQTRGLPRKITASELRKHPEYLTELNDNDLEVLAKSCGTLAGLQKQYGQVKCSTVQDQNGASQSKATVVVRESTPRKPQPGKAVAMPKEEARDPRGNINGNQPGTPPLPNIRQLIDLLDQVHETATGLIQANVSLERATEPWRRCMELFATRLADAA